MISLIIRSVCCACYSNALSIVKSSSMTSRRSACVCVSPLESIDSSGPSTIDTTLVSKHWEKIEGAPEWEHNLPRFRSSTDKRPRIIQRDLFIDCRGGQLTSRITPFAVCDWVTVLRLMMKSLYSKRKPRAVMFDWLVVNAFNAFIWFINLTKLSSATSIEQCDCSAMAKQEAGYSEWVRRCTVFELGATRGENARSPDELTGAENERGR